MKRFCWLILAAALSGCGAAPNMPEELPTVTPPPASPTTPITLTPPLGQPLSRPTQVGEVITPRPGAGGAPIEVARAELAKLLDISPDEIGVLSVERVTWPDSCLGCAGPDMACLTVLTEGYRILLTAQEAVYPYHTDTQGQHLLCLGDQPRLPVFPLTPGEIQDGQPWMEAGTAEPTPSY